jgi:hypothetical protein
LGKIVADRKRIDTRCATAGCAFLATDLTMIRKRQYLAIPSRLILLAGAGVLLGAISGFGQAVIVTLSLDTNRVAVGETTVLRAFAQIAPAFRTNSDRIFSWYVDLVSTNASVARIDHAQLQKPFSDNNPRTSSPGHQSGSSVRGIYDTFLERPGAGKDAPILLFSVPIQGVSGGASSFRVDRGSGVDLSYDFIVAPSGGGDPYTGGEYRQAQATLNVGTDASPTIKASLMHTKGPAGQNQVTISFPTVPSRTYTVEFRENLSATAGWQALPGAPHNSGTVRETNSVPSRFYRIRAN